MKISDIILEDENLTVDQIAQIQAQHGSSLSNNVISRAKRIVSNKGISALDAIGMAQDIERRKQKQSPDTKEEPAQKIKRTPMTRPEPTTSTTVDRVSDKSGKKWGNQYYQDKKTTPGAKYKAAKDKIKQVARDVFNVDSAELGADISKDFVNVADKLMKSNIRKPRK